MTSTRRRSTRTRDRLVGALVGAVLVVVLLVAAAGVAFVRLSHPVDAATADPAPPPPPLGSPLEPGRATPPADLAPGETWLGDVVLDAATLLTTGADLRDVSAVGSDVRTGDDGIRAGRLAVDATVPFDVVARQIGPGTTVAAAGDGQASVRRTVEVLGRELDVVATGTVEVVGGRLVVNPRSIDVGGPAFVADAVAAVARELVVIEQDVEGLPAGLLLRQVTVTDAGFRARLDGEDVEIAPTS